MGEIPEFEPAPPVVVPPLRPAHNHSSTGRAGLQFAQDLKNDGDDDLVIESVRAEVPAGPTVKESGSVAVGIWTEYYVFSPPTLPLKVGEGKQIRLVLRFHATCPPAVPAPRIPWRLFVTVTWGSGRQEVEVGSLADIELTPDLLKEFCDA